MLEPGSGATRRLVVVLAVAAGVAVANLYYAQPLLSSIARDYHVGSATAGLVVTVSQLGYAVGLALVLPLGDLLDRRRLVPAILVLTAIALAGAALAPTIGVLIALAGVVGVGSVVVQIVVPLGAELAPPAERGRVVGTIMTGLLLGILLGRTAAGTIAGLAGWRTVYLVAAGLVLALALGLRHELPQEGKRPSLGYGELLRSIGSLIATQPILRRRCLYGALGFAAFSTFWTSIAFLLAGPPFHYGDGIIGLFGLVGAAGALAASVSGRLADAGKTRPATGALALSITAAFVVLGLGARSLAAVIAGILILDVGSNGLHVLNQSTIYAIPAGGRSRLNSAYMTSFFLGGAAGSAASAALYSAKGWSGVCVLGAALGVAILVVWMTESRP